MLSDHQITNARDPTESLAGRKKCIPPCQVPGCTIRLPSNTGYHKRYKICQYHAAVPEILLDGQYVRFCQQCGHFQPLKDFDGKKKSCRRKLELHNIQRKRKRTGVKRDKDSLLSCSSCPTYEQVCVPQMPAYPSTSAPVLPALPPPPKVKIVQEPRHPTQMPTKLAIINKTETGEVRCVSAELIRGSNNPLQQRRQQQHSTQNFQPPVKDPLGAIDMMALDDELLNNVNIDALLQTLERDESTLLCPLPSFPSVGPRGTSPAAVPATAQQQSANIGADGISFNVSAQTNFQLSGSDQQRKLPALQQSPFMQAPLPLLFSAPPPRQTLVAIKTAPAPPTQQSVCSGNILEASMALFNTHPANLPPTVYATLKNICQSSTSVPTSLGTHITISTGL